MSWETRDNEGCYFYFYFFRKLYLYRNIYIYIYPPKKICDYGSDFIGKAFTKICKDHNINIGCVTINNHSIPHGEDILGIVDSFIQKLRKKIQLYKMNTNVEFQINA